MLDVIRRIVWWCTCDRLGPDIPLTHLLLYSRRLGRILCRKRFARFGNNSQVRPHVWVDHPSRISIGANVVLRPGCMLFADLDDGGEIVIEDDALIGPNVQFFVTCHDFRAKDIPVLHQGYLPPQPIKVSRGSWIGANVVVLRGVTIGENAVVGAGSVVTRDVPPRTVVAGVPAKVIRHLDASPDI